MKIWKKIFTIPNINIQISWNNAVEGGVEAAKQVLELAKALNENKTATELAPLIGNISSLLDVLNSPLVQVAGASLPFVSIATKVLSFIIERTHQEPSLEICVALVSQAAYLESLRQFLRDRPQLQEKLQDTPASPTLTRQINQLGENLELDGEEVSFGDRKARDTLLCFHESPLAKVFNPILKQRLQESGLEGKEAEIVTERVSRSTHRYLKEAVAEMRDKVPRLAAIYGDGWQKDLEAYSSIDRYLEEVIARKPKEKVFTESFTFGEIYVPLKVKPVGKNGEVEENENAQNMEDWAENVLQDGQKQGQVLFIQAEPGRGKSVFCRMFADKVRRELHPIWTPILIPLRDIEQLGNTLKDTLEIYLQEDFVSNDSGGWLTDRNTRFLFLLDGFDELLMSRGLTNQLKQLLDQVATFQKEYDGSRSGKHHRILLTGRTLALYGIERDMPHNLAWMAIMPMDGTVQQQWFGNWKKVVDRDPTKAKEKTKQLEAFLQHEHCPQQVQELAREPLLLYLLAVMSRDGKLNESMFDEARRGEAKVLIYERAVEWVLEKQRSSEGGENMNREMTGLEAEDLQSILLEAGLSVAQSGREYASIAMIEERLEQKEDEAGRALQQAYIQSKESQLKNALATFYVKAAGADNAVEFFHKSFGDFLCAKRIAESLKIWTFKSQVPRKTYEVPTKDLEWEIYDLLGYGNITPEIVQYVVSLLEKSRVDWVVLLERLNNFYLDWSKGKFIEAKEKDNILPLQKARQLQKWNIDRGQRQVDIYTGLNVITLLYSLHRYGQSREDLQNQIAFHPCGKPNTEEFDKMRLRWICRYVQTLGRELYETQLSYVNISHVNYSGADLSVTEFTRTDLSHADLSHVNLSLSDLSQANLSQANLSQANLTNISWSEKTNWEGVQHLEEAVNVPEALKQHLGMG